MVDWPPPSFKTDVGGKTRERVSGTAESKPRCGRRDKQADRQRNTETDRETQTNTVMQTDKETRRDRRTDSVYVFEREGMREEGKRNEEGGGG